MVSCLESAIQEVVRPIPRFEDQEYIGFIDFYFKEDPFKNEFEKLLNQPKKMNLKKLFKPKKSVFNIEKIGRNAPCTCGSGKKYKKCCGK